MRNDAKRPSARIAGSCHASRVTDHGENGIALVITLIMLAVTLVMAVAFMALAKRERGSVTTTTDIKVAELAAESGAAQAEAQINANALSGFTGYVIGGITNGTSSNAFNLHLIVSTNYINPNGFISGLNSPTNVNYYDKFGNVLGPLDFVQNVANLWYLPRAPVMVGSNEPVGRFYLDLNENGRFDPNGMQTVIGHDPNFPYYDTNGNEVATFNAANVLSNYFVGDPEWIGVLEHPDAPHGPNNHFTSRYAFIAIPAGNTMDVNYIHNQARNTALTTSDGFMRNQGVGSWEINLSAFLADLNTNLWGRAVGSRPSVPALAPSYYDYEEPNGRNQGVAFDDARTILKYRWYLDPITGVTAQPSANYMSFNAAGTFPVNGIDDYSQGPLQITLNTNEDAPSPTVNTAVPWSGGDNTNHFFTVSDFFDTSKLGSGLGTFVGRLNTAGTLQPSYDRYTFYRMLSELGTDSSPDDGKLNLNYCNINTNFVDRSAARLGIVTNAVGVVIGAETNLQTWRPLDFFLATSDQLLRNYSSFWYTQSPVAYTNTYAITNSFFTISNIPVWVSNRFVYSPAVNRLLQLAANIYDATTNGNNNLPHVFKPILERNNNGDVFIVGYKQISSVPGGAADPELQDPVSITSSVVTNTSSGRPIVNLRGGRVANVYGVPWIIGAKKGLPNFNQFFMTSQSQVTRKLEVTRTTYNPATARYGTNQMYIIGISNNLGVSFWNSYSPSYSRPLTVVVREEVFMGLTNSVGMSLPLSSSTTPIVYFTNVQYTINQWPGSQWAGNPNAAVPNGNAFLNLNSWSFNFINPSVYRFASHSFDPVGSATSSQFEITSPALPQLPQFGVAFTNFLQAFILDGNNVIDYVQLNDPTMVGGLNQPLADPDYPQPGNIYYQWSTNSYPQAPPTPYGVINQIWVAGHPGSAPAVGGQWAAAQTPMGDVSPAAEAAYFRGFFTPNFQYNGQIYVNHQLAMQVPYTPSRTVYSSYLLQANDPLVHYLGSDLNSQIGGVAVWAGGMTHYNGVWTHSDDPQNQPIPQPPPTPIGGRYQPWGRKGQMAGMGATVDGNLYNLAYKDPGVWRSDYWDFPTNQYPTVGWLGRVHRGTPWQTVYLKSTNILSSVKFPDGYKTWATWMGSIQTNLYAYYFDAFNSAPQQDYLLFDMFTTRYNDNAVRGTVPVNVGAGQFDGGLAAWSALFSGMTALSNNMPAANAGMALSYTPLIVNPAGPVTSGMVYTQQPPVWQIVNGPFGINATRANTNWFPSQTFAHAGQVLATPALSVQSPFLNLAGPQKTNAINDEMYEWLPQQMMGLVRGSEPRYVLYCFGQTLRPAPNGTVLSGPYFQLVTNYQVVAESAIRAVVRIDNANTARPHAVVESYNVLPPN